MSEYFNEQGKVEIKAPAADEFDEYEQASIMFADMSKQFRKMGYALAERKKKSAIRVLEAFIFSPLEDVKLEGQAEKELLDICNSCLLYTSPSPRDATLSRMPSSA